MTDTREPNLNYVEANAHSVLENSKSPGARALARDVLALSARLAQAEREREQYRIEADCGLRDYDALELDAGVMVEALQQIAEPRTNHTFDPWARDLARKALSDLRVTQVRADG